MLKTADARKPVGMMREILAITRDQFYVIGTDWSPTASVS